MEQRYLDPEESFEVTCRVVLRPVERPRTAWQATIDRAWEAYKHDIEARYGPDRLWELALTFARDSLWQDDGEFTGFGVGVGLQDGEWTPRHNFEIGWVGQNAALATAFLQDYLWNGTEEVAYYLASWQWHYSVPLPAHSMLEEIDYDTFGGTNVAVQHQCQDPWGALIAVAWLRLVEAIDDPMWRERAVATWNQASIGVSDGSLTIDGIPRPTGAQDETFMYTYWGWPNTAVVQGDASRWLPAWPSAFRLFTLVHWDTWDDFR